MDWSPTRDEGSGGQQGQEDEEDGSLVPPAPPPPAAAAAGAAAWSGVEQQRGAEQLEELQELSFSLMPSLNSSGRRLGRKISHKKSASDTFAFAAGQDFLALLAERPPLEPMGHARHAFSGAGLAGTEGSGPCAAADVPSAQPGSSSGQQLAEADAASRAGPASKSDPGTAASPSAAAAAAAAAGDAAAAAADAADADVSGAGGGGPSTTQTRSNALDTTQLDPRKAKRILANRQSAQRSRMKRLQHINELEGRKDKAEAALRELRGKVDRAQRSQAGLAQEVEEGRTQLTSLQQQLLHEQNVQASLSSYVQALQLQVQQQQQQQQWGCSQQVNGAQVSLTAVAGGYSQLQNGDSAYAAGYDAAAAQYAAMQQYPPQPDYQQQQQQQHHHQQQAVCNGMSQPSASSLYMQQQQQWAAYDSGQCDPQHQQAFLQQQAQQQHGVGYGYGQAQQVAAADQHLQQQPLGVPQPAADAAAVAAHRRSLSAGGVLASGGGAAAATAASQQHHALLPGGTQPGQAPGLAAAGAMSASDSGLLAAAAAAGSGQAQVPLGSGNSLQQTLPVAVAEAGPGEALAARRGSLSKGSGSVLLHGSVSDADLDSLLGLGGPALSPAALESDRLEPIPSQEIRSLLASGDSVLMLSAEELLARDPSSTVKMEAPF